MTRFKTPSEKFFADYLDELQLFYDYEKSWGGKNPDFTVYSNKSKKTILAIADIKDAGYTKHEEKILREKGRLIRQSNPFTGVRKKIHAVREQFKYAKEYPCVPIIYSRGPIFASPLIVFGAMLGDIGVSIPIRLGGGVDNFKRTESFFGKGGKMIDERHGQPQNQTITAIGLLGHLEPEAVLSGFHEELKKRLKPISIEQKDWLKAANRIAKKLKAELKSRGYKNLERERSVPYLDFVINPFARLTFPRKFFEKGYTYIHEYDLGTGEIKLTYDWTKPTQKNQE